MQLLKDSITNSSGDVLREHGVEGLGFLNSVIVRTGGKCIHDVVGGDLLIFGDNVEIVIASGGY